MIDKVTGFNPALIAAELKVCRAATRGIWTAKPDPHGRNQRNFLVVAEDGNCLMEAAGLRGHSTGLDDQHEADMRFVCHAKSMYEMALREIQYLMEIVQAAGQMITAARKVEQAIHPPKGVIPNPSIVGSATLDTVRKDGVPLWYIGCLVKIQTQNAGWWRADSMGYTDSAAQAGLFKIHEIADVTDRVKSERAPYVTLTFIEN